LIVVDASVAVRWIANEPDAESALMLLQRDDLAAPDLLAVEVGSALRRKEKDGELTRGQVVAGLELIFDRVRLHASTSSLMVRAVEISAALGHPIYDCMYVTLTEALGGRFVSHDIELLKRVRRSAFAPLLGELASE
jgi:predicted nucleic acid-binding protein